VEWGNKLNTKKKILVVDDKGMNRYMLGGIFRDNYEIIEAGGGMEAIAIIDKEYDELAVILLDIIMPGIDGFGVLEHMKEQDYLNRVPVVIVTDDSSEATAVKAFEYKVADMVIKPFEPRIIKRRVENIIELYAYKEKYGNA
jgi:PleD family two-component response regulator